MDINAALFVVRDIWAACALVGAIGFIVIIYSWQEGMSESEVKDAKLYLAWSVALIILGPITALIAGIKLLKYVWTN